MSELLPCPFCGEEISMFEDSEHSTAVWAMHHEDSDCFLADYTQWHVTEDEAVKLWNTRADRAQAFREGQERGFERAKKAIADIPYGRTEEVCEGHEDAYRAIEKLEPEDLDQ